MSGSGYTPQTRWQQLVPNTPYFDGRCEAVVSYNFVHRCKKPAVTMCPAGFAVCDVHTKTFRLRDEHNAEAEHFIEQFDVKAAHFRFGHLAQPSTLAPRIRALAAQWDF